MGEGNHQGAYLVFPWDARVDDPDARYHSYFAACVDCDYEGPPRPNDPPGREAATQDLATHCKGQQP